MTIKFDDWTGVIAQLRREKLSATDLVLHSRRDCLESERQLPDGFHQGLDLTRFGGLPPPGDVLPGRGILRPSIGRNLLRVPRATWDDRVNDRQGLLDGEAVGAAESAETPACAA